MVDAKGALVLPEFKNALVGTVATKAMELAKTFMPVEIRPIPQAELDSVREMMILGTAHECIGVTHFEGRPIGDGKTGGYIGLDKQAHFDIYNLAAGSCVPKT